MKNYLQINGKKIELSAETVKNFEAQLGKDKGNPRRPNANEDGGYMYYYLHNSDECGVRIEDSGHCDKEIMDRDFDAGLGFKTKEEGETKLEWMKAVERVKDYITKEFGEFKPKEGENKHNLYCAGGDNQFMSKEARNIKNYSPIGYLKTEENVEKVIESCEADLKIIWGV